MNKSPTYEELASALVAMDEAYHELFAQCCSNPIYNSWNQQLNLAAFNKYREQASSTISKLRLSGDERYAYEHIKKQLPPEQIVEPEPKTNLQSWMERDFDEYSFRDILLANMVDQERRRQDKNCPVVEDDETIQRKIEEELGSDMLNFAAMLASAFSRIARGEVK